MATNRTLSILIALLLSSLSASAQHEVYNAGGVIHTNKDAVLHVNGEIENKPGATIINDGVIELAGNLTHDSLAAIAIGADSTSTERVYKFIGSGRQFIKGNFSDTVSGNLYNVIVDKAISGSAIELRSNIILKGSLIFGSATTGAATYTPTAASILTDNSNRGTLRTFDSLNNDFELYLINPNVNAVKGYAPLVINAAPTDRYVITRAAPGVGKGGLSRKVNQTGAPYVFPIGSSQNGYNASAITFSSIPSGKDKVRGLFVDATGGIGSISKFCVGCGTAPSGAGFNYYFNTDPCHSDRPQWVILNMLPLDHGYWSFAGDTADVYSVEMYPNSSLGLGGTAMRRIIKGGSSIDSIPSGDWTTAVIGSISSPADLLTYATQTGCYSGTGIPGGRYTGFAHFQIAGSPATFILPIVLISLTATPVESQYIDLAWITAQEINNLGFKVFRSENGADFQEIGWVDAQGGGNSNEGFEYHYEDHNVQPGIIYYYKLDQIDNDGTATSTYLVQAQIGVENVMTLSDFFPNPATGRSQIVVNSPKEEKLTAEVYNIAGQIISRTQIDAPAGGSLFVLSTHAIAAGSYKVVIKNTKYTFIKSLIIQ